MISARTPVRVLLTGPAGSGKSGFLRHLRRELAAAGSTISTTRSRVEIGGVPAEHVLVVDDAHLLDDGQLSALAERSSDPEAALVLAARPWPQSDSFRALAEELERSAPAVVLGSIGRADLRAHIEQVGDTVSDACLDALLDATGGTAWLVSESLAVHHTTDCAGDADHDTLHDALRDVIAHRLRTVAPDVRYLVELLCLGGDDGMPADRDDLVLSAYAEGLLLPGGRPAPVVRSAVRATSSIDRIIRLYEDDRRRGDGSGRRGRRPGQPGRRCPRRGSGHGAAAPRRCGARDRRASRTRPLPPCARGGSRRRDRRHP